MLRRLVLAVLAALTLSVSAAQADPPTEIGFGIISTDSSAALKKAWGPLLSDMEKAIGVKVDGFYAADYAGIIEAMRFNKVQVAWYGNAAAIQAVDRSNGEVFAQHTYADGSKGYYSLLITNVNSPLKSIDDVIKEPGKLTFGNGDPNSTSGFLMPGYYAWAKNNIDIRTHFTRIVNANHQTNLLAVANREVDLATNNTEDMARLQKEHPDKAALIREIWRSPIIPSDPIVWRKDLDDGLKQKIKAFLLSYGQPGPDQARQKEVLEGLDGWGGFIASTDAQLLPIRQVMLYKDRLQTDQDAGLAADIKKQKLAEIDAKLAQLSKQAELAKAQ
ncbi:MAG: phosphonate ABC transporter substrate-binding protein [Dongiaceae bacterium]